MIELRFSFLPQRSLDTEWIEKNIEIQWECKVTEKVDASSEPTPFELYSTKNNDDFYNHITVKDTSVVSSTATYIIKSTYVYDSLKEAIEDTELFTRDIKAFIEVWKNNSIKGNYTITI